MPPVPVVRGRREGEVKGGSLLLELKKAGRRGFL